MLCQCADAYQGSNFYLLDELVLISMNVKPFLVEKVQFAKTLWVHLDANAPLVLPVIQQSSVQEHSLNNVALMLIVNLEKRVSQENVFVEEDLILTRRLENAKI